jgi:hypothetical protein
VRTLNPGDLIYALRPDESVSLIVSCDADILRRYLNIQLLTEKKEIKLSFSRVLGDAAVARANDL